MSAYAASFLVMIIMVLAEIVILKYFRGKPIPWLEIIANLHSGQVVLWLFRGVEIVAFGWLLEVFSLQWVSNWSVPVQWLFAFVAWDFCFYWMHRLHHQVPFLWSIHSVHHQGEDFNLTLATRNSWYSSLSNFPFIAVLALLGVPLEIFVVVSSIHYSVQFYNHTALVGKSGFLDRVLVTPSNHRVHHGVHPMYIDRNFGGTLLLWDKLFGSYQVERDDIATRFGLRQTVFSYNPFWFNHKRLFDYFNGASGSFNRVPLTCLPSGFIGCAGVLLFLLVIYYVNEQGRASALSEWSFFTALILASFSLGGMADKRKWGLFMWVGFCFLFPIYVALALKLSSTVLWLILSALCLSSVYGLWLYLDKKLNLLGRAIDDCE